MRRPLATALALLMLMAIAALFSATKAPVAPTEVDVRPLSAARGAEGSPGWKRRMRQAVRGLPMSVEIRYRGRVLFRKDATNKRPPASVQKLLLSMALFHRSGNDRIETLLAARRRHGDVVRGDLWVFGRGDPSVTSKRGGGVRADFPTRLTAFVKAVRSAGIERIRGSVAASKTYFKRDWDARGWLSDYQEEEVALPTALSINENVRGDARTLDPELVLARKLTRRLRAAGIRVGDAARTGDKRIRGLDVIASVESAPFWVLARDMNKVSNNFFAEVLGKRLGVLKYGTPGTIRKGSRAIKAFARARGVRLRAFDSSGLSWANRVSPRGVVSLLRFARNRDWWPALRRGLPGAGEGTLEGRLGGVKLRAKTGTLDGVSTLAGWVWLERVGEWAEFAILSRGLSKERAVEAENELVRLAHNRARP
ncbi:MAG: D-alanyl-D-alanine carboxypeptidase [Actinomycetota bacterium]|nr:D-alanyl-D-alanine carboxypeptidase [Actinomycetota bacterium]